MQKVHLAVLLAVFMIFSPGCRMPPQPEPAREGEQAAQPTEVQLDGANFYVLHYFNDELGRKSMDEVISLFRQQQPGVKITGEPMDHETFKVAIPSLLEGARPRTSSLIGRARGCRRWLTPESCSLLTTYGPARTLIRLFLKGL